MLLNKYKLSLPKFWFPVKNVKKAIAHSPYGKIETKEEIGFLGEDW